MSVFTHLTHTEISALLAPLGYRLVSMQPASAGIENSNYLLRCEGPDRQPLGRVLTILETIPEADVPWFVSLMQILAQQGLPVPAPQHGLLHVHGKPALLAPWLPGHHVDQPTPDQCRQVGALLARLHGCPPPSSPPPHDERQVLAHLQTRLSLLPEDWHEPARQTLARWRDSKGPRTLVHADLFRDNVLFFEGKVSGVLDLYHACLELPVYDLAVALNDWCTDAAGEPDPTREAALLEGYGDPGTSQRALLPLALAVAALRFWLSRAEVAADSEQRKDPMEFARIFARRWQALAG